ncbi:MAG: hypothetical protein Q9227_001707 [Pyrenula ochraceoflavens]
MDQKTVVLCTGANTGLGFQIIRALCGSEKAYEILLGGRSLEKAQQAAKSVKTEFPSTSSTITPIQIDIEDDDSINRAFHDVESEYGRLDSLVNNAGAQLDQQLDAGHMTMRQMWNQSWNVNTTGTQCMTAAFVPLLLKSHSPHLLFVTSGTSTLTGSDNPALPVNRSPPEGWPKPTGGPSVPAYRSSKTGMNMMMREWHRVLKEDGVKVWCISPGYLATGLGGSQDKNKAAGAGDPKVAGQFISSPTPAQPHPTTSTLLSTIAYENEPPHAEANAPKPPSDGISSQNTTDGLAIYFGDDLQKSLNQALQSDCKDLYSDDCHTALQNVLERNETSAQPQARDLNSKSRPLHRRQQDDGAGAAGATVATGLALEGAALLAGTLFLAPAAVPFLLAGFAAFALIATTVVPSSPVKEMPKSIQIPKADVAEIKKEPNLTSIEFPNGNQKPLVVQQNATTAGTTDSGDLGDDGASTDQGNSTGDVPYLQTESNGDYTIHLSKTLSDMIDKILAQQASNCSAFANQKRGRLQTGKLPRDAPGMYPPQVQQCIVTGMMAMAGVAYQNVLKPLLNLKVPPGKPVAARPKGPDVQKMFAQAFAGTSALAGGLSTAFKELTLQKTAVENTLYWISEDRATVIAKTADRTTVRARKAEQDDTPRKYCPFPEELRCENPGCLGADGKKTLNEICPPTAKDFPNCPCTDCADDEYMPFCDNCGGAQEPSDPNKPTKNQGRDLIEGGLLPREAPDLSWPATERCKGFKDQGWSFCKCIVDKNPPPYTPFKDEAAFLAAQNALLNLPSLPSNAPGTSQPDGGTDGGDGGVSAAGAGESGRPGAANSSVPSAAAPAVSGAAPNPSGCPEKAPPDQSSNQWQLWVDKETNSCDKCPDSGKTPNIQSCKLVPNSETYECGCIASPCQDASCWVLSGSKYCPNGIPKTNQPQQFLSWFNDPRNACASCPGGAKNTKSPYTDGPRGWKTKANLATCSEPYCFQAKCHSNGAQPSKPLQPSDELL